MSEKSVFDLVQKLTNRGVELWPEREGLRYVARGGVPSVDLLDEIRARKHDLTAALAKPSYSHRADASDRVRLPEHQLDWWNEVAANPVVANGMHAALRISGRRDPQALQAAMSRVFARHELLRCRLHLHEGVPCITPQPSVPEILRVREAHGTDADIVERMIWRQFEGGAAFRSFLIERAEGVCIVGFVLHHFVADFCSCRILMRELLSAIRDPAGGTAIAGPASRYSDYLRGLNEWLAGPAPEYRLHYWRDAMRSAPAIRLDQDHDPGPAVIGPLTSTKLVIDRALRARMAAMAASVEVTLLTVILAAKFVTLARLLGRTDLVLTPVLTGRDDPFLLNMVGNTVNCLPLRVSTTPDLTFAELLLRVHETQRLAYKHELPWRLLLRRIAEVGASWVSPTVNLIPGGHFRPRASAEAAVEGSGAFSAVVAHKPPEHGGMAWHTSHELHLFDSGQEMHGAVKYTPLRYRAGTMERFARTFVRCLECLTSSPQLSIGEATE